MIPGLAEYGPIAGRPLEGETHVLVVAREAGARFSVMNLLLGAGIRVTAAATFGVVEMLLEGADVYDLMITAQSAEEITQFGVAQLARSMDANLPILVLEADVANSPAIVGMVDEALLRWPLRERPSRTLH